MNNLKEKYPVDRKFDCGGFRFQFTRRYARNRFKVRLLEKCKFDHTGQEFTIGFDRFKFTKRLDNKTYRVIQLIGVEKNESTTQKTG